jgi:hypothetical protein
MRPHTSSQMPSTPHFCTLSSLTLAGTSLPYISLCPTFLFALHFSLPPLLHADFYLSNTGTPNSFVGVDVANLTGGVYNSATLLEGNNLGCFVYQLSAQAKPDILLGPLNALTSAIGSVVGSLGCPQLKAIDARNLNQFPGYTRQPVYG